MATSHPIPTHKRFRDLTGQRFGRLLVIGYAGPVPGHHLWNCQCDCGRESLVRSNNLLDGHTIGCGCVRRERFVHVRHRGSKTPEWNAWQGMKRRCTNPAERSYKNYGGRGITVCARWLECFENFLADMGQKPSPGHSLDRIDNNGPYSPGNCRWATKAQQDANKRRARPLTFNGETQLLSIWAKRYGLTVSTLAARLERGWTVADAITTPTRTGPLLKPQPFTWIA